MSIENFVCDTYALTGGAAKVIVRHRYDHTEDGETEPVEPTEPRERMN